ncbi:MAG: iduronate sulfatase [Lacunisphaera sp.]|nr:iduronate sulfatase [Lacunisphaera sp.]MDB6167055.1 iduronate sulfatase [Lacunisphaera sp.]
MRHRSTSLQLSRFLFAGLLALALAPVALLAAPVATSPAAPRYNVLLIAIDDLNDWVGSFGGSAQTRTPNMDRFCAEGAVAFQNAYCPGPVCGPSRSALLSGFLPNRTGVYSNTENMRRSVLVQTHATLPEYFAQHGYMTANRGKIFHKHATPEGLDEGQWAFTDWSDTSGRGGVDQAHLYSRLKGIYDGQKGEAAGKEDNDVGGDDEGTEFSWGPTKDNKENTLDWQTAEWAAGQLAQPHAKPFFLAVGIAKPHLPWYVPQEYFDRHPLDSIKIPEYRLDDLDDILTPDGKKKFSATADFRWVQKDDLFKRAVQAYLACASYADDCVGKVLDALAKSPERDHTIVIIFGDHGWHLGEKLRFRKSTLWQEATRLPLMIRVPGMTTTRQDSPRIVNLIDLYPTLIDLCGLPTKAGIDGRVITPLLRNPQLEWAHPSVTVNGSGNACVRDERWYFIRYRDGTEELYDMQQDPMQWTNLARSKDTTALAAKARLAAFFPTQFAPNIFQDPPKKRLAAKGAAPDLPNPDLKRDLAKLQ